MFPPCFGNLKIIFLVIILKNFNILKEKSIPKSILMTVFENKNEIGHLVVGHWLDEVVATA